MLFYIVVLLVYIPIDGVERLSFFTPPPAFIVHKFFDDNHSDLCEMIPHCSFDLHFSNN